MQSLFARYLSDWRSISAAVLLTTAASGASYAQPDIQIADWFVRFHEIVQPSMYDDIVTATLEGQEVQPVGETASFNIYCGDTGIRGQGADQGKWITHISAAFTFGSELIPNDSSEGRSETVILQYSVDMRSFAVSEWEIDGFSFGNGVIAPASVTDRDQFLEGLAQSDHLAILIEQPGDHSRVAEFNLSGLNEVMQHMNMVCDNIYLDGFGPE